MINSEFKLYDQPNVAVRKKPQPKQNHQDKANSKQPLNNGKSGMLFAAEEHRKLKDELARFSADLYALASDSSLDSGDYEISFEDPIPDKFPNTEDFEPDFSDLSSIKEFLEKEYNYNIEDDIEKSFVDFECK